MGGAGVSRLVCPDCRALLLLVPSSGSMVRTRCPVCGREDLLGAQAIAEVLADE